MRIVRPLVALLAMVLSSTGIHARGDESSSSSIISHSSTPFSVSSDRSDGLGFDDVGRSYYGKAPRLRSRSARESPYDRSRSHRRLGSETTPRPEATLPWTPEPTPSKEEIIAAAKELVKTMSIELALYAVMCVGGLVLYLKKWRAYDRLRAQEDPLQYLHGLRREDMEDLAIEALKWQCAICYFHNPEEKPCCSLCDTTRGTELALVDMNSKQRCARARKQWWRTIDDDGVISWEQHISKVHKGPHYIVAPAIVSVVASFDNDVTTATSFDLQFQPLTAASAGVAVTGAVIPSWWLPHLTELTTQSFSLKYAWLLTQIAHSYKGYSKMRIYRDKIFEESLEILMFIDPVQLCSMTRIELLGESGIDAGGVLREWYSQLTLAVFEPARGLFIPANKSEQSYFINPAARAPVDLRRFQAIGRMLGGAIVDGQVLPFRLALPLFKMLLGAPLAFQDVWHVDESTFRSLVFIRDTDTDVSDLELDFSVLATTKMETGDGNEVQVLVDLVPEGRHMGVTMANRAKYVECMTKYLLFDRIQPQVDALVRGLYEVIPPDLLMPFDAKEFELLVCGYSDIDVADWRASTSASLALRSSKCLGWFWDIVQNEMTHDDRAKLLRFATGSSRVPLQGFKGLTSYDGKLCPFSLKAIPYTRGAFPKAHSCFNRIDLPVYPDRALLQEALTALVNLDVAEFTME
ncbi:Aste57867_22066 [Aphanomyces stellatus]|uniref:HECT-type E3 ubiquitin transferase n=1 Tax=Aphanomyces stellatus TaxID=120398 RepID=A0A485LJ80_9STRA|nr:hypothetical protein As57867_021997 [Aphanomyces stellatus]VFT98734.1 Aste57867_22066 [Aphanomyces stellatus]